MLHALASLAPIQLSYPNEAIIVAAYSDDFITTLLTQDQHKFL